MKRDSYDVWIKHFRLRFPLRYITGGGRVQIEREYESKAPDLLKAKENAGLLKVLNWETGEAQAPDPQCIDEANSTTPKPTRKAERERANVTTKSGDLTFMIATQTPLKKTFNVMRKESLLLHVEFLTDILESSIGIDGV